jgi:hypothetical protein
MNKQKNFIKPSTKFRKQLKLKVITKSDEKNDYEGFNVSDFQEGTASYNGLQTINLIVSGKWHNILTFIVEGYFSDVTAATVKFAESLDPVDYELSDVK